MRVPAALAPVAIRGQDLRSALAQREPRASLATERTGASIAVVDRDARRGWPFADGHVIGAHWRCVAVFVSLPHRPPSRRCPIRLREPSATHTCAAAGIRGIPISTATIPPRRSVPHRLRRRNRARAGAPHGVEIALPKIAWEDHLAASRRRRRGHRRRRDRERSRSAVRLFLEAVSNGDRRSDPAERSSRRTRSARSRRCSTPSPSRSFGSGRCRLRLRRRSRQRLHRRSGTTGTGSFRRERRAEPAQSPRRRDRRLPRRSHRGSDHGVAAQGARCIEEHPLRFSTDIHFMLSRATQTPQMLARLDDGIDELQAQRRTAASPTSTRCRC